MSGSGRRFRLVAVLAAGIAIGVAMAATPVSGHIGKSASHLWNAHLKAKTDERYYTKAQANARYLPTAGTAANSEQLDGLDSTAFLPATGKAADADTLDGLDSTAFLPATGKAADADTLDGLDSGAFARGNAQVVGRAIALELNTAATVAFISGGFAVRYICPAQPADNGVLRLHNDSGGNDMNLFVESGEANPTYEVVPFDDFIDLPAHDDGDSFHLQVQGDFGFATIEAATVNRSDDCHAQAQIVLSR
jgi:hypothetical protein